MTKKKYEVTQSRPIRAKDETSGIERVFSITAYANRKGGSTTRFDSATGKKSIVRPFGTIIEVHPNADKKRLAALKIQIPASKKPKTGNADADKIILKQKVQTAQAELDKAKKGKDAALISKAEANLAAATKNLNESK